MRARSRKPCAYLGGGDAVKANLVVETLIFDESQITSPDNGNRPTWGGAATHSIRVPEEAF